MSDMESVRVRLQFEDRHILSKSQRKEGLKRSWILLKPHHETVSDLSHDILHAFELQESCPHGVVLSMDGFVLPPFESTSVIKDKDVVWIKKKERSSTGTVRLSGGKNSVKALEAVDKQPMKTNLQLLAKEEFTKESGGYESESEEDEDAPSANKNSAEKAANEDAYSKKRKASKKLKSPKRKKSKLGNAEERSAACEDAGNGEPESKKDRVRDDKVLLKCGVDTVKSPRSKGKSDEASTSKNGEEVSGNEEPAGITKNPQDDKLLLKDSQTEKEKDSHSKGKKDIVSTSENDGEVSVLPQSTPQGKGIGSMDVSPAPSEAKKLPSRSARRKKVKRQWLREMKKIGKKEEDQNTQSPGGDDWRKKFLGKNDQMSVSENGHKKLSEHQQHDQNHVVVAATGIQQHHHDKSSNHAIVPFEIRPGHIRFEPLDEDADRPVQKSPVPVTTFQWNGLTDKRKGQKWGKEKVASKWTDNSYQKNKWTDNGYQKTKWIGNNNQKTSWSGSEHQNTARTDNNNQKTSWAGDNYQNTAGTNNNGQKAACGGNQNLSQESPQEASQEKATRPSDSMDFTKFPPYGPVPQEGDIVAYRVIELSSSWTPEVSPFRVGKISSCNQDCKKVRLLPVAEHPFDLEKVDKGLYAEDGSLEVDFTALIDVRSFKPVNAESAVAVAGQTNGITVGDSNAMTAAAQENNNNNEVNKAPAQENGGSNVWEDITRALSAKKEQLSQEDRWRKKGSSANGPPSSTYRGARGGALGPIMALLRAQNAML